MLLYNWATLLALQPEGKWHKNKSHSSRSEIQHHGYSDKMEAGFSQSLSTAVVISTIGLLLIAGLVGLAALVKRRRRQRDREVTRSRANPTTLPQQQNSTFLQVKYSVVLYRSFSRWLEPRINSTPNARSTPPHPTGTTKLSSFVASGRVGSGRVGRCNWALTHMHAPSLFLCVLLSDNKC